MLSSNLDIYSETIPGLIVGGAIGATIGARIGTSVGCICEIISGGVYNGDYFTAAFCSFTQCGLYSGVTAGGAVGLIHDFK